LSVSEDVDHGPYSNKIDLDGCAKGLLEFLGEVLTFFVGAFVEGISKGDLLFVVRWQQPDLFAGERLWGQTPNRTSGFDPRPGDLTL
jgi:hypothetical protein